MLDQVRQTITRYKMLTAGDRVLVAVSGGVDSVVSLHVLKELKSELKLTLAVAHFDHGIRPDSAQDAEFVRQLARSPKLRFYTERADVPAYAQAKKLSLEVAARQLRYQFLEKTAKAHRFNKIALGHTLNDQAETLLMRLVRGSGLEGLAGIPPVRSTKRRQYIRPLIECTREQIEAFAKAQNLQWREDPTNRDRTILRNRIRHELIPILRGYNPNLLEALGRTARLLSQAAEHLEHEADQLLRELLRDEKAYELALDLKRLLKLPQYLQALVLRQAVSLALTPSPSPRRGRPPCLPWATTGGCPYREGVGVRSIEAVLSWASRRGEGELALPAGVRVLRRHDHLIITTRPAAAPKRFEHLLTVPGETVLPEIGWRFKTVLGSQFQVRSSKLRDKFELRVLLDTDKVQGSLRVRNRRPGDRISLKEGTKKLQDLFVDRKIPREARDTIPLICDENALIWIVGQAVNEAYRVTPRTQRALEIIAERM